MSMTNGNGVPALSPSDLMHDSDENASPQPQDQDNSDNNAPNQATATRQPLQALVHNGTSGEWLTTRHQHHSIALAVAPPRLTALQVFDVAVATNTVVSWNALRAVLVALCGEKSRLRGLVGELGTRIAANRLQHNRTNQQLIETATQLDTRTTDLTRLRAQVADQAIESDRLREEHAATAERNVILSEEVNMLQHQVVRVDLESIAVQRMNDRIEEDLTDMRVLVQQYRNADGPELRRLNIVLYEAQARVHRLLADEQLSEARVMGLQQRLVEVEQARMEEVDGLRVQLVGANNEGVNAAAARLADDNRRLAMEVERLSNMVTCRICLVAERTRVLECGHAAFCQTCVERLTHRINCVNGEELLCPLCWQYSAVGRVRVIFF